MHELHQTIAAGELWLNANRAFALAENGPAVILSRAVPRAVLMTPEEWNRIARRLELLEALLDAQWIDTRNDEDNSWVSSTEMRERPARRGVDMGSSLWLRSRHLP